MSRIIMQRIFKPHTLIVRTLLFSIGIMLSCNVFAAKPFYEIGDTGPGGGIVFFITDDEKHGLEAASNDQYDGQEIAWDNGSHIITSAARSGVNGGRFNTDRIIISQAQGNYAALVCANYQGGGYGDWYLPSIDELDLMYTNLHSVGLGGFVHWSYWSSTEIDLDTAWRQYFGLFGDDQDSHKGEWIAWSKLASDTIGVRAVRAF